MSFATFADLAAATRLERAFVVTSGLAETNATLVHAGALPSVATTPGTSHSNDPAALAVFPTISGVNKFLVEGQIYCPSGGSREGFILYDRLVSVNQVITSTGDKTINSTALPRYTSGEGVMVFLEVTVVTATAAPIISMNSYTNQAGSGGRAGTSVTFPAVATNVSCWIGPMPLQSGDYGVRSVETINVATASGGSGAINVVLAKPIWWYDQLPSTTSHFPTELDEHLAPPRIFDGASLGVVFRGIVTAQTVMGGLSVALDG